MCKGTNISKVLLAGLGGGRGGGGAGASASARLIVGKEVQGIERYFACGPLLRGSWVVGVVRACRASTKGSHATPRPRRD
jgi:hypothetical protein